MKNTRYVLIYFTSQIYQKSYITKIKQRTTVASRSPGDRQRIPWSVYCSRGVWTSRRPRAACATSTCHESTANHH